MNWLIIGSTATYHWFKDARKPFDIDLLTPAKITTSDVKSCFVDSQWNDVAEEIIATSTDKVFADPDILFTLKVSHAHWDVKWDKTMFDIDFLKRKGAGLNYDLYHKLVQVWEVVHGKKRVNLNQPLSEFFNDAVKREYDHEYLHELVAFYNRPLHERLRPDLKTAWCSQELFDQLSFEDQCKTALEEMMATAIERGRLTYGCKRSQIMIEMSKAHFRLCTSMTKGWFARFLILNRHTLLSENKEKWIPQMNRALLALSTSKPPTRQC